MRVRLFMAAIFIASCSFAQEEVIPEGWDKIILEGEVAYMNLVNGEVSKSLPKSVARAPKKVKEFEPTIIHYVKEGDTFSKIARKYNLSLAKLFRLNSFEDFDKIEVGQEVVVGYKDEDPNYDTSAIMYHIVRKNETLYRISTKYGVSIDEIKRLNGLTSNFITVGQKLQLR